MAERPIVYWPNEILRQRSRKVTKVDHSIQQLVDDMAETMRKASGVGLAAVQVGELWRVVTIQVPADEDDPQAGKLLVLINPEIVKAEDDDWEPDEGCLSVPGYIANVRRYRRVTARALDRRGKEFRIKGEGLLAQAIQHEIDHLNGVLFFDHLASLDLLRRIDDEPIPPEEEL